MIHIKNISFYKKHKVLYILNLYNKIFTQEVNSKLKLFQSYKWKFEFNGQNKILGFIFTFCIYIM